MQDQSLKNVKIISDAMQEIDTLAISLIKRPEDALGQLKENMAITKEAMKNEKDITTARINAGSRDKKRKDNK